MSESENSGKQGRGGKFRPGQSGNPGGRPREAFDFKALARSEGVPKAYAALLAALEMPGERVPAAKTLLAYALGMPTLYVDAQIAVSPLRDVSTTQLVEFVRSKSVTPAT